MLCKIYSIKAFKSIELFIDVRVCTRVLSEPYGEIGFAPESEIVNHFLTFFLSEHCFCILDDHPVVRGENRFSRTAHIPFADQRKASFKLVFQRFLNVGVLDTVPGKHLHYDLKKFVVGY